MNKLEEFNMADYVSNKELYAEMVLYKAQCDHNLSIGLDKPIISDKIASAIVQIANRMMNSRNFSGYSYRDEMAADGILQCLAKIDRFDINRGENVFSYASQIVWNSSLARIKKEKHQCSVKARMLREKMSSEFVEHAVDYVGEEGNSFIDFLKDNEALEDFYETAKNKKPSIHPSLVHRNKTSYVKKVPKVEKTDEVTMEDFV